MLRSCWWDNLKQKVDGAVRYVEKTLNPTCFALMGSQTDLSSATIDFTEQHDDIPSSGNDAELVYPTKPKESEQSTTNPETQLPVKIFIYNSKTNRVESEKPITHGTKDLDEYFKRNAKFYTHPPQDVLFVKPGSREFRSSSHSDDSGFGDGSSTISASTSSGSGRQRLASSGKCNPENVERLCDQADDILRYSYEMEDNGNFHGALEVCQKSLDNLKIALEITRRFDVDWYLRIQTQHRKAILRYRSLKRKQQNRIENRDPLSTLNHKYKNLDNPQKVSDFRRGLAAVNKTQRDREVYLAYWANGKPRQYNKKEEASIGDEGLETANSAKIRISMNAEMAQKKSVRFWDQERAYF